MRFLRSGSESDLYTFSRAHLHRLQAIGSHSAQGLEQGVTDEAQGRRLHPGVDRHGGLARRRYVWGARGATAGEGGARRRRAVAWPPYVPVVTPDPLR